MQGSRHELFTLKFLVEMDKHQSLRKQASMYQQFVSYKDQFVHSLIAKMTARVLTPREIKPVVKEDLGLAMAREVEYEPYSTFLQSS